MAEKYKCMKCGYTFDEDEMGGIEQWDGEGVMGGWHVVEGCCPNCGETDYMEEAADCTECGETCSKESELTIFDTEVELKDVYYNKPPKIWWEHVMLCPKCLEKIKKDIANGTDFYEIKEELEEMENGSI